MRTAAALVPILIHAACGSGGVADPDAGPSIDAGPTDFRADRTGELRLVEGDGFGSVFAAFRDGPELPTPTLSASDRFARKCPRVRRWLAAMKPHRSMPFQPKEDRIEVRAAEANRVVTPLVQSEVMHRDRDSDLLKRLPLKKPGHRDRCLPNQYLLVLMMGSHRVWMTNQSHVAALHLP